MDVRFLSVEFLNTYLTTYRIFSDAVVLFDTLLRWYYAKAKFQYPESNTDSQFEKPSMSLGFPFTHFHDFLFIFISFHFISYMILHEFTR